MLKNKAIDAPSPILNGNRRNFRSSNERSLDESFVATRQNDQQALGFENATMY